MNDTYFMENFGDYYAVLRKTPHDNETYSFREDRWYKYSGEIEHWMPDYLSAARDEFLEEVMRMRRCLGIGGNPMNF